MRLAFRVTTAAGRPLRCGIPTDWHGTEHELAAAEATDVRNSHPEADGDLTVHVWPARDNEHYLLPIPDDAQRFDYPWPLTAEEVRAHNARLFGAARAALGTLPVGAEITVQLPA